MVGGREEPLHTEGDAYSIVYPVVLGQPIPRGNYNNIMNYLG